MTEPMRVEIWRYSEHTITVARSDGAAWNENDSYICGEQHDGVWNSRRNYFVPNFHRFSDGTPVSLYEGLNTVEDT